MPHETERKPSLDDLARQPAPSLASEFVEFLKQNKKWWLIPILLMLGLVGVLTILATSGAAPFLYTFF